MARIQCEYHRTSGQLEAHLNAKDKGHADEQEKPHRTVRFLYLMCRRQSYGRQALPVSVHDIDEQSGEQRRFGPSASIGHVVDALGSRSAWYLIRNAAHSPIPLHFGSLFLLPLDRDFHFTSTPQGTALYKWKPVSRASLQPPKTWLCC